eukprot:41805-Chlamydomonas_euryale.AAC.1
MLLGRMQAPPSARSGRRDGGGDDDELESAAGESVVAESLGRRAGSITSSVFSAVTRKLSRITSGAAQTHISTADKACDHSAGPAIPPPHTHTMPDPADRRH